MLLLLACVLIADFLTGLFHWWEDTYGREDWPLLGPLIVRPNLDHHAGRPLAPTYLGRNGLPLLAAGLVLLLAGCGGVLGWPLALTVLVAAHGNEVHAWAHGLNRGRVAALLHDMGLAQSPAHHRRHHRHPDGAYCTVTNLLNPVLDRLRFWRGLEYGIRIATGARPVASA